ncbi:MAG: hypothetical protein K0R98_1131 [Rickettsiaceae bacterium]|jgi:hypothetical protein|nr:hypothetical protein [Rickettsiaceae bacterium]
MREQFLSFAANTPGAEAITRQTLNSILKKDLKLESGFLLNLVSLIKDAKEEANFDIFSNESPTEETIGKLQNFLKGLPVEELAKNIKLTSQLSGVDEKTLLTIINSEHLYGMFNLAMKILHNTQHNCNTNLSVSTGGLVKTAALSIQLAKTLHNTELPLNKICLDSDLQNTFVDFMAELLTPNSKAKEIYMPIDFFNVNVKREKDNGSFILGTKIESINKNYSDNRNIISIRIKDPKIFLVKEKGNFLTGKQKVLSIQLGDIDSLLELISITAKIQFNDINENITVDKTPSKNSHEKEDSIILSRVAKTKDSASTSSPGF